MISSVDTICAFHNRCFSSLQTRCSHRVPCTRGVRKTTLPYSISNRHNILYPTVNFRRARRFGGEPRLNAADGFHIDQLMHAVGATGGRGGSHRLSTVSTSTLYCAASLWWTSNMPSYSTSHQLPGRQPALGIPGTHGVKTGSADLPHLKTTNMIVFAKNAIIQTKKALWPRSLKTRRVSCKKSAHPPQGEALQGARGYYMVRAAQASPDSVGFG